MPWVIRDNRQHLEGIRTIEPLTQSTHAHLVDRLREYYIVGGMPEAVRHHAATEKLNEVREIQGEIVRSYELDFAKHAPATDIPRLTQIWESIPKHLARENKKFVFSAVRSGARAREYERALTWLDDAGLILRAFATETSRHPLSHHADRSTFKVYALDVGLLGAMAGAPVAMLADGERLFTEYRGALVENFVAQELVASFQTTLHYWRSRGGKAELDFLLERDGEVLPLEVKAGVNPRSKSLKSYDAQFSPPKLLRTNLLNLKQDGKTCNCPSLRDFALAEAAGGRRVTQLRHAARLQELSGTGAGRRREGGPPGPSIGTASRGPPRQARPGLASTPEP